MNIDDTNNLTASRRLLILVRADGVETLVGSSDADEWHRGEIAVNVPGVSAPVKTLEEAVYTSPGLLADYSDVDVVADSKGFVIVPSEIAGDSELVCKVVSRLWPDRSGDEVIVDNCESVVFLTLFDKSLVGFVNRTFVRSSLHGRMAMLTSFFMSLSAPVNRVKLYVRFDGSSRVDIVALTSDSLLMANSFECDSIDDAVYFIMTCVKDCGFDELDDEMLLCGDADRCAAATDILRQYINSVMPLLIQAPDINIALELLYLKK